MFYRLLFCCTLLFSGSAFAHVQWEVEADPMAYALKGFSAHVARPFSAGRFRLQLGTYGAELPQWTYGNSAFTVNSRGGTIKFDYFPLRPLDGLFFGVDSNYSHVRYELNQTHERRYNNITGLGPRVGYRFNVGEHFYVSPWISLDYQFGAKDVSVAGETVRGNKYSVFPTVHLGWRF